MPHLGWTVWPDAFQLPLAFQDDLLQVMHLRTGCDGSVHLVPRPGQRRGVGGREGTGPGEEGRDGRGGKGKRTVCLEGGSVGEEETPAGEE